MVAVDGLDEVKLELLKAVRSLLGFLFQDCFLSATEKEISIVIYFFRALFLRCRNARHQKNLKQCLREIWWGPVTKSDDLLLISAPHPSTELCSWCFTCSSTHWSH